MDSRETHSPDESGSWPAVSLVGVGCKVLQDAVDGLATTVDDFTARIAEYEGKVMQRQRKILAVDDDESTRKALMQCLRDVPRCEVVTAADGEEAIRQLAAHAFDLILVDLNLGGGPTGMDVIDFARAQNEVVPIVVVSGLPAEEVARLARQCRANAAIQKPVDIDALAATVGRLLDRRRD